MLRLVHPLAGSLGVLHRQVRLATQVAAAGLAEAIVKVGILRNGQKGWMEKFPSSPFSFC
jgi:hypothetical protein